MTMNRRDLLGMFGLGGALSGVSMWDLGSEAEKGQGPAPMPPAGSVPPGDEWSNEWGMMGLGSVRLAGGLCSYRYEGPPWTADGSSTTGTLTEPAQRALKVEGLVLNASHPFVQIGSLSLAGLPLNVGSKGIPLDLFCQTSLAGMGLWHGRHPLLPGQQIRLSLENVSPWHTYACGGAIGFELNPKFCLPSSMSDLAPVSRAYNGLGHVVLEPGETAVLLDTFNRTMLIDHIALSVHLWQPPPEHRVRFPQPDEGTIQAVQYVVRYPGAEDALVSRASAGSTISPVHPPTGRSGLVMVGEGIEVEVTNTGVKPLYVAGAVVGDEPSYAVGAGRVGKALEDGILQFLNGKVSSPSGPINRRAFADWLLKEERT